MKGRVGMRKVEEGKNGMMVNMEMEKKKKKTWPLLLPRMINFRPKTDPHPDTSYKYKAQNYYGALLTWGVLAMTMMTWRPPGLRTPDLLQGAGKWQEGAKGGKEFPCPHFWKHFPPKREEGLGAPAPMKFHP